MSLGELPNFEIAVVLERLNHATSFIITLIPSCQFHYRMNFPSGNREDGFSGLRCVTENKPVSASRYCNY